MFRYSLHWYIFSFILLELVIKTHLTVHDSSHGFVSKNQKYFDEDISSIQGEISSNLKSASLNDLKLNLHLKFQPSFLDFKKRPLGVPHLEKVFLFNADSNRSIDMTSISGSTVHFHSSFFEDKKIPPLGNTSFSVVFLGREEGFVQSSLFIQTNEGRLEYNVKGSSIYSPFKLRPIVGVKLPVNATFSPLIYLHNPHTETIQIVEIYSSGGDFHLELPSGDLEGPKAMWEIPPLQTKAVIRVRFQAKTEQNHTAYVRIKLNITDEVLVVPLEVEVAASGGLFHPQGFIDFGIGGHLDGDKVVKLCVHNPLKKPLRIHSVTTTSKALKISYDNVKIQPDPKKQNDCVEIGSLKLNWKTAFEYQDFAGKITITYKHGKMQTDIPYYLTVLEGGLSYDSATTRYFINDKTEGLSSRYFKIKNDFATPVRLINFTMGEGIQKIFNIVNFKAVVMKPKQELNVFMIKLKNGINLPEININSFITLKTNVTEIRIPVLIYNGKLGLHLPFETDKAQKQLDLGLIGFDSKKELKFLVYNNNPVNVTIRNIKTSLPASNIEIIGCSKGNYSLALLQVSYKNLSKCQELKLHEFAIIRLTLQTSKIHRQVWGDIQIETQFEYLSLSIIFKVAPGKLEIGPDRLVFDQCFPGKICSHPIRVHSTFTDSMTIEKIVSLPPDSRLWSQHTDEIVTKTTKIVGYLYLDPTKTCKSECYTALQEQSGSWLRTLNLWKLVHDEDVSLVNIFYNRYLNLTYNGQKKWQNLTLRMDTTEVKGHIFKTRVKMSWPTLLVDQDPYNKSILNFPLTQIGNTTYKNITIKNPSSHNLVVQIVFDKHYPGAMLLYEGLPPNFIPNITREYIELNHDFFLHENYRSLMYRFREKLGIMVDEYSLPLLLKPGENFTFTVGFKTTVETEFQSALLLIRNNLTVIEVLRLTGQGSYPLFKFGNRKPGSVQPLAFELTEKHLKDCEKERHYRHSTPNLTVKRSFTARNNGEVPIYINNFYINGLPCEGYGFKVLNCHPFVLHPNGTKKIDIAFTPDLTLSKVVRTLILDTSLGFQVNYTLHTTVPYHYLSLCSNVIARPYWELILSYAAIFLMTLLLAIVLILAFMDSTKVIDQAVSVLLTPSSPSIQPTLDLRLVGQQVRSEIRSIKLESNDNSTSEDVNSSSVNTDKEEYCERHNNEDNEKSKIEVMEKSPAIIPTVGKAKRKLAKKTSGGESEDLTEVHHKKFNHNHTHHHESHKNKQKHSDKEEKKAVNVMKELKKTCNNNSKKNIKYQNVVVPVYEEETSSTTTESSSNNDEAEKENEQANAKVCSKRHSNNNYNNHLHNNTQIKTVCHNSNHDEQLQNLETQNNNMVTKVERKKFGLKNSQKSNRDLSREKLEQNKPNFENNNKKNGKVTARERKEKQALLRKLSAEKSKIDTKVIDVRNNSPSLVRASPPISNSSIWNENKASFSDVVAANSTNRPLSQLNQNISKPTMYVEPYKQSSELGPIGSRRTDHVQDDGHLPPIGATLNNNINHNESSLNMANTLFPTVQDIECNTYFNNIVDPDPWTSQPSWPASLFDQNLGSSRQDIWNQSNNSTNNNTYWNNNFNLLGESAANDQQPPFLWSNSWTWMPPAPELPRTPTRTPPGFDDVIQRTQTEQTQQTIPREDYHPFASSTNIWTQPETYRWDYSQ